MHSMKWDDNNNNNNNISRSQVQYNDGTHNRKLWVIVDGYILDVTQFADHHPAGAKKIIDRRAKSIDISSNFLDHFGHTVRAFRDACRRYDETQSTVALQFKEVATEVFIIGKVDQ